MKVLLLLSLVVLAGANSIPSSFQDELEKRETPGQVNSDDGCQPHATRRKCGSACPATCTHPNSMCMALICDNSCYCDNGYVLDEKTEQCVLKSQCSGYNADENLEFAEDYPNLQQESVEEPVHEEFEPDSCQDNSTYTECGTACPITCSNRNSPPMMCTMQCVIGCECKKGYMLTSNKERCILPDDCF